MAIILNNNQYKHSGRGPLDAKALVKTYQELITADTWLVNGKNAAYNGMVTAVWLNKTDTDKNGIYFLHDAAVTSTYKAPDVTNEANWHKLSTIAELEALESRINTKNQELATAIAANSSLLAELATSMQANADAIEILNGDANTEGSIQKIITDAITNLTVDPNQLPIATALKAGMVKASDEILVAEDGTMELGVVSTDKLEQGKNTLVLNGGSAVNAEG